MPINIDIAAIIVMESMGVVSFLMAFLFFGQRKRISDKQRAFLDALNKRLISERGTGKCYSSEWVMDHIVHKRKKIFSATPLLIATLTLLLVVFSYGITAQMVSSVISLGYASVIALLGISIILWTDAFEAYSYTSAIYKVATKQLDKEDQSYIELAREAVEKAFLRFASLGVAFAVLGPFIPQIFKGIVYVLVLYATMYFQVSEAVFKVLTVFGALIVLILPGVLLFLPEFLGRIIIRKGKSLTRRLFRRGVEQ